MHTLYIYIYSIVTSIHRHQLIFRWSKSDNILAAASIQTLASAFNYYCRSLKGQPEINAGKRAWKKCFLKRGMDVRLWVWVWNNEACVSGTGHGPDAEPSQAVFVQEGRKTRGREADRTEEAFMASTGERKWKSSLRKQWRKRVDANVFLSILNAVGI